MKGKRVFITVATLVVLLLSATWIGPDVRGVAPQAQLDTIFTYQGYLEDGGVPANGSYDFEFTIYNAETGGSAVVSPFNAEDVAVTEGAFAVDINVYSPADVFEGNERWIEVGVRPGNSIGSYETLTPRQPIRATPYAFSLWPGAEIVGENQTAGAVLTVQNTGVGSADTAVYGWSSAVGPNSTVGVHGQVNADNGAGVRGASTASTGFGFGVEGVSNASGGRGVYGRASATSGANYGVYGWTQSSEGHGVYGLANASTGLNYGVYGESQSSGGIGVYGEGWTAFYGSGDSFGGRFNADDTGTGVYALGKTGVTGIAFSGATGGYGGFFTNHNAGEPALYATGSGINDRDLVLGGSSDDDGTVWSDEDKAGSDLFFYSNDEVWIYNSNNDVVFSVDEGGNVSSAGATVNTLETSSGSTVGLYGVESTGPWVEDFGTGRLVGGEAVVTIDPLFAEAVDLSATYHLFLTPLGDCALYVAEKTAERFSVAAQDGRDCSLDFDYRIVARRAGAEDARVEGVDLNAAEEE
jgi:hypothetical protein